jgi:geranylgeranyl pyrophosphate synthase
LPDSFETALGNIVARKASRCGDLSEAVAYSMQSGGKRLRARLVFAAFESVGRGGDVTGLAGAVEAIHAYSLVHDDLPCMDDDDLRRGRATVHKVFGTAVAMRAGLALLPIAMEMALESCASLRLPERVCCTIVRKLAVAAGGGGMIAGQLRDLEAEGMQVSLADLERTHAAKTGALISASVVIGGLAGESDEGQLAALELFGDKVGLAFQIVDDVLDVTSTSDVLGKTAGRDVTLSKSTYPSLMGIEQASKRAKDLIAEGRKALASANLLTERLSALGEFAVARVS